MIGKSISKTIERLSPLVEGADIAPSSSEETIRTEGDLLRTTIAVVLEQAPSGSSAEELGNAIVVGLGEAAELADEDPEALVSSFHEWIKRVGESASILSESLKE